MDSSSWWIFYKVFFYSLLKLQSENCSIKRTFEKRFGTVIRKNQHDCLHFLKNQSAVEVPHTFSKNYQENRKITSSNNRVYQDVSDNQYFNLLDETFQAFFFCSNKFLEKSKYRTKTITSTHLGIYVVCKCGIILSTAIHCCSAILCHGMNITITL